MTSSSSSLPFSLRWSCIEVFNGHWAASLWWDSHGSSLVESAISSGALDFEVKPTAWGMAFEVCFRSEEDWEMFRNSDAVVNCLSATPDPNGGILIYRGRSLDYDNLIPRKPKPFAGAGAAALPLPFDDLPLVEAVSPRSLLKV